MKTVWIFSFECAGVVKVGGLGEAVYNIARSLANRGFEVTVFMPSHGAHKNPGLGEKLALQKSIVSIRGRLREKDFLPYRRPFSYNIGMQMGSLDGFKIVLFYGLNKGAKDILDDETVYRSGRIEDKSLLLARGISGYVEHLQDLGYSRPDIIHAHDYHAIPAAVLARQRLESYAQRPGLILTVHLLSLEKCSWNFLGKDWCGIENKRHQVQLYNRTVEITHGEAMKKAKFKIESFGAIEADVLATVSRAYLQEEVMKHIGHGCESKIAFHWNGCDWDYKAMLEEALKTFGNDIKSKLGRPKVNRYDLREYFLTKAIGNLEPQEPVIDDEKVREVVYALKRTPFLEKGKIEPFLEDGPMILMTGRLTQQKGVNILFKAFPLVLKEVPNVKFVLLMLPLEEEIDLIKESARLAGKYKDSLRVVLGKAPSIYSLAHLSSDVFVCPSKWEPFGIMTLEAMATGNPVVATLVGGLKEIVVDLKQDLANGTGILVRKNDHKQLADALISLLTIESISETLQKQGAMEHRRIREAAKPIRDVLLKEMVIKQPSLGSKLRKNAIGRVEKTFRWNKTINMTIDAYEKAARLGNSV